MKPIQGGGVGVAGQSSSSVKPRGAVAASSQATTSTVQPRTNPLGSKLSQTPSGPVKRGLQASDNDKLNTSRERLVSPRGSVTGGQIAQPRLPSRENSQSKLQYRREGSSSSLRGSSSKTDLSQSVVKRRGETSRTPESQTATDSAKSSLLNLFKIGDRVLVGNTNPGAIAFIGETRFAKGEWAGIVLDEPVGKNNGSVQGVRYFECQTGHGIFTKLEKLTKINQIPDDDQGSSRREIKAGKTEDKFKIGDRVVVSGTKHGVVRYLGETGFAKGDWAGIELDEPLGKNDGAVAGRRYFQCEPTFGLFAPLHKIVRSSLPLPIRLQTQLQPENDLQNTLGALGSDSSLNSVASTLSGSSLTPKPATTNTSQIISSPEPEESEVKSSSLSSPEPVQPPPSSGVIASQLVTLQEALEDREKQIQSLLADREFEQAEVASATNQVAKAEEEITKLKESHNEAIVEKDKVIEELQLLVKTAKKEKTELQTLLDEEKRKVEDLQFKLEEEEITLGDELQIEQKEIETLEIELKEKVASLARLEKEFDEMQGEKNVALLKIAELKDALSESDTEVLSFRTSLTESENKIKELEATLFATQEQHSSDASFREQEVTKISQKIAALENDLEEHTKIKSSLENELKTTKSELAKTKEDNESLHKMIEDLTDKLHTKEDEFASLCSELQVIKDTTLELQKQLHLSEVKSENLTADKNKLESEIAELAKNSGDSSQKMVYLNEQLREKDRILDKLKSSSAEAQIQIGRLSEDLSQAKELHNKDLQTLKKSHQEQTRTAENMMQNLRSKLEESLKNEENLKNAHHAELEDLKNAKDSEHSAAEEQIKQKTERINTLTKDLHTLKASQEETLRERSNLEEQHSKLQSDFKASQQELAALQIQLESVQIENNLVMGAQGDAQSELQEFAEKYSMLNQEYQNLVQAFDNVTQENTKRKEELVVLYEEKTEIDKEKQDIEAKLNEMKNDCDKLQKEIEVARSQAYSKEDQLRQLSLSASEAEAVVNQLKSDVKDALVEKDQMIKEMNVLTQQNQVLQQSVDALQKDQAEKNKLSEAMVKAQKEIEDINLQLLECKTRESSAKVAADSERESLKKQLQTIESLVKKQSDEISSYKKENEMLKNKLAKNDSELTSSTIQSVSGSDVEGMVSKLRETQDLLEAVEAEKESAEAQVDFLNSVIVDLQRKTEEQEKRIELLMMGDIPNRNGTMFDISDDDEPARTGIKQRLFCDICDVFDQHDTDDCPTQSSGALDDQGTQYHGNRNEDRPYCDICEVFGHWTQECDDEETF